MKQSVDIAVVRRFAIDPLVSWLRFWVGAYRQVICEALEQG